MADAARTSTGDHPDAWVDLHPPRGRAPLGTVVVLHGGFWKQRYDASLADPLARDLAGRGWLAAVVEYRRGPGAWPAAGADVLAGIGVAREHAERLAPGAPLVGLGHSAGGHLAVWAAGERAGLTHVVAQAGVLDLGAATRDRLGAEPEAPHGAVAAFFGDLAGSADPARRLPLGVPLWALHARADEDVPFAQSFDHVAAARAAGDEAHLVEVPGDHYGLIDPAHAAWAHVVAVLDEIAGPQE